MNCSHPDCGALLEADARFCPMCGRVVVHVPAVPSPVAIAPPHAVPPTGIPQHAPERETAGSLERRYGALRTIASLYIVLAWIALIVGLLLALPGLASFANGLPRLAAYGPERDPYATLTVLGGLVFGVLPGLAGLAVYVLFRAGGEGIRLAIDVEENTRAARLALEQRVPKATSEMAV